MVDDVDAAHAERLVVIHPLRAYENPGEGQTSSHSRQLRNGCLWEPHAQTCAQAWPRSDTQTPLQVSPVDPGDRVASGAQLDTAS